MPLSCESVVHSILSILGARGGDCGSNLGVVCLSVGIIVPPLTMVSIPPRPCAVTSFSKFVFCPISRNFLIHCGDLGTATLPDMFLGTIVRTRVSFPTPSAKVFVDTNLGDTIEEEAEVVFFSSSPFL